MAGSAKCPDRSVLTAGDRLEPEELFRRSPYPCVREAKNISAGAKRAWLTLALHVDVGDNDYPTQRLICRKMGVGRERGRRFIQELVDFGLVEPLACGRRGKKRYAFKWHSLYEKQPPKRPVAREHSLKGRQGRDLQHIRTVIAEVGS